MKENEYLKFRLATLLELAYIAELDSKANLTSWNKQQYLSCFNNPNQYLYVLDSAAHGIIAAIATSIAGNEADILQIWVKRDCQNQGYGKIILMRTLKLLEKSFVRVVFLEVMENNEGAIIFYTKFGFKVIGARKNYYKVNNSYFDALLMSLEIANEK